MTALRLLFMSLVTVTLHTWNTNPKDHKPVASYCTAVFISPTEVLTAAHCIEKSGQVVRLKSNGSRVYSGVVLYFNPIKDLAIIKTDAKWHFYTGMGRAVGKGDRVYTVNSGEEMGGTYGEGYVKNIILQEGIPNLLHSIEIFGGASGSGLFDRWARLVGINTRMEGATAYAVETTPVRQFLESARQYQRIEVATE